MFLVPSKSRRDKKPNAELGKKERQPEKYAGRTLRLSETDLEGKNLMNRKEVKSLKRERNKGRKDIDDIGRNGKT